MQKITHSPIIVALDYNNRDRALEFVDRIDLKDCRLKVGKEMFTLFGPKIVYDLKKRGFEVFLDLKFHDIPHTTARAVIAAAELGVWMINVHALGGVKMMIAARQALEKAFGKDAPILIAVTELTSITNEDLHDLGIGLSSAEYTKKLARLTKNCGLDGVVCSAQEAMHLRNSLGDKFKLIAPGIRLEENGKDDQNRTMTPKKALQSGVDYIVIGRSITQSQDPAQMLKSINASLNKD